MLTRQEDDERDAICRAIRIVLTQGMRYLAGSTGVLAHNRARLLRGLTSSGLWAANVCTMAGILPQCTAREAVQRSKTWVPTLYSLITPAKGQPIMGDRFQLVKALATHLTIHPYCLQSHKISHCWGAHYKREPLQMKAGRFRAPTTHAASGCPAKSVWNINDTL